MDFCQPGSRVDLGFLGLCWGLAEGGHRSFTCSQLGIVRAYASPFFGGSSGIGPPLRPMYSGGGSCFVNKWAVIGGLHSLEFLFPQIWDLADPEGKGFLDKQVYTCTYAQSKWRVQARSPGRPPLHFLFAPLACVTRQKYSCQSFLNGKVSFLNKGLLLNTWSHLSWLVYLFIFCVLISD